MEDIEGGIRNKEEKGNCDIISKSAKEMETNGEEDDMFKSEKGLDLV